MTRRSTPELVANMSDFPESLPGVRDAIETDLPAIVAIYNATIPGGMVDRRHRPGKRGQPAALVSVAYPGPAALLGGGGLRRQRLRVAQF